jgi:hypothetical protein
MALERKIKIHVYFVLHEVHPYGELDNRARSELVTRKFRNRLAKTAVGQWKSLHP